MAEKNAKVAQPITLEPQPSAAGTLVVAVKQGNKTLFVGTLLATEKNKGAIATGKGADGKAVFTDTTVVELRAELTRSGDEKPYSVAIAEINPKSVEGGTSAVNPA